MPTGGFEAPKGENDVYINIVELSQKRDVATQAKEDHDATESSSSFGGTISGNDSISGLSDAEVESSQIFGADDLAPQFDGFSSIFHMRKKNLTSHWRKFVHPLTWRCKWTEIKIKALEARASKYARLIALYEQRRRIATDQIMVEQSGSRSLPYVFRYDRRYLMKRRKRKRVENTVDNNSCIPNHFLFNSRDNKTPDLDGIRTWEDRANSDHHVVTPDALGVQEDCIFSDDDDTFLEDVLCKIELVQSRVQKMKSQLDSVMRNNPSKISSSDNGDTVSVGDLYVDFPRMSDCGLGPGGFIFSDETFSSFGEAIPVPDIIESTVGLLSYIDVTHHQAQLGDYSEKIVDNILLHNEAVESSMLINSCNQWTGNHPVAESGHEESSNAFQVTSEVTKAAKASPEAGELVSLKSYLASEIRFPQNKRKRGERKAGTGNWNRQLPVQSNK